MIIIGLSGKAGAGKDYIGQRYFLHGAVTDAGPLEVNPERTALRILPIAQADPIKELAVARGLCTYQEAFHTKPPHVRHLLQQLGTEQGFEKYGATLWCMHTYSRMQRMAEQWGLDRFVVTDIRFPHEVDFWRSHGATLIRVFAPDRVDNSSLSPEARAHLSETALDTYDPTAGPTGWSFEPNGPYWDAILDNRLHVESSTLDYQMTMICRIHDIIKPDEYFGYLPGVKFDAPVTS